MRVIVSLDKLNDARLTTARVSYQCDHLSLGNSKVDPITNFNITLGRVSKFDISQLNLAHKLVFGNEQTTSGIDFTLGPHHGDHLAWGSQDLEHISEDDTDDEEVHEQLHHVEEETCDVTNGNLTLLLQVGTIKDNTGEGGV